MNRRVAVASLVLLALVSGTAIYVSLDRRAPRTHAVTSDGDDARATILGVPNADETRTALPTEATASTHDAAELRDVGGAAAVDELATWIAKLRELDRTAATLRDFMPAATEIVLKIRDRIVAQGPEAEATILGLLDDARETGRMRGALLIAAGTSRRPSFVPVLDAHLRSAPAEPWLRIGAILGCAHLPTSGEPRLYALMDYFAWRAELLQVYELDAARSGAAIPCESSLLDLARFDADVDARRLAILVLGSTVDTNVVLQELLIASILPNEHGKRGDLWHVAAFVLVHAEVDHLTQLLATIADSYPSTPQASSIRSDVMHLIARHRLDADTWPAVHGWVADGSLHASERAMTITSLRDAIDPRSARYDPSLGPSIAQALSAVAITDPDPYAREAAMLALSAAADEFTMRVLEDVLLEDPDARVRGSAATFIHEVASRERASSILANAFRRETDESSRARVLRKLVELADPSQADLFRSVQTADPHGPLGRLAAEGLARLP